MLTVIPFLSCQFKKRNKWKMKCINGVIGNVEHELHPFYFHFQILFFFSFLKEGM